MQHAAVRLAERKFITQVHADLAALEADLAAAATAGPAGTPDASRVKRARQAFQKALERCARPPTLQVHLACLAASQRRGDGAASSSGLPLAVPRPDAQAEVRALLGLAKVESAAMRAASAALCSQRARQQQPARGGGAAAGGSEPAGLRELRQASNRAMTSLERALEIAKDRRLLVKEPVVLAQMAELTTHFVVERLRVRDHAAAAAPVNPPEREQVHIPRSRALICSSPAAASGLRGNAN